MVNVELPREVVERARRGDRAALTQVLARYAKVLHRLARISSPGTDAEELAQAMLAKLVEVLPRFEPDGPATLTTWVMTVAHRFLLDERKRFRPVLVSADALSSTPSGDDVEQGTWRREVGDALEHALSRLPQEQLRPVVLVHVFEHSVEEVADVEGVPVGTIKSRLFRARVALGRALGPTFAEELRHG